MTGTIAFLGFAACASVIFLAGRRLAVYGDRIAEITGLGGAWIGIILMATVTSLPELMVGISAAAVVGSADLAVGDILGSCAFNLLILAALDVLVPRRRPLFGVASQRHVLTASLQVILIAIAGFGLMYGVALPFVPWISVSSLLFVVGYVVAVRLLYRQAQRGRDEQDPLPAFDTRPQDDAPAALTARQVGVRYAAFAAIIIVAATALPPFAQGIAQATGFAESLVGTLFLAASTSLPEVAVSISVVRMGAVDLAVGNLLGSNLFNILILAVDDAVYTGGLLLQDASDSHLVSILSTVSMTAIAIIGLTLRLPGKRLLLAWDAALIMLVYGLNLSLLALA